MTEVIRDGLEYRERERDGRDSGAESPTAATAGGITPRPTSASSKGSRRCGSAPACTSATPRPEGPAPPGLRGRRQLDRRGDGRPLLEDRGDDPRRRLGVGRRRRPGDSGRPALSSFTDLSTLEVVLTKAHAGGKFDHDTYKVSGGLHGVGVTVVNALSEWLEAEVHRDGKVWKQDYKQGEPTGPVREVGPAKSTGTKIQFLPDIAIFPMIEFDYDVLEKRLRELAYLNKGIRIAPGRRAGRRAQDGRVLLFGRPGRVRRLPQPRANRAAHPGVAFRERRGAGR